MLNEKSRRAIFETEYKRSEWYNALRHKFGIEKLKEPADISALYQGDGYNARPYKLGNFETPADQLVGLYEVCKRTQTSAGLE
jgi:hypothetical protein